MMSLLFLLPGGMILWEGLPENKIPLLVWGLSWGGILWGLRQAQRSAQIWITLVSLASAVGLVFQLRTLSETGHLWETCMHTLLASVAVALGILLGQQNWGEWTRNGWGFLGAAAGLVVALWAWGTAPLGSSALVNLSVGGHSFQPLALVSIFLTLSVMQAIARHQQSWMYFRGMRLPAANLWLPPLLTLGAVLICASVLNDYGSVLVATGTTAFLALAMFRRIDMALGIVVMFASGVRLFDWINLSVVSNKIAARWEMMLHPFNNTLVNGEQAGRLLWALPAGGWGGMGLEAIHLSDFLLPRTDSCLGVVVEAWGTFGLMGVSLLYIGIALSGIALAEHLVRPEERVVPAATGVVFATYFLLHLGMLTGWLPITGVGLPFLADSGAAQINLGVMVGWSIGLSLRGSVLQRGIIGFPDQLGMRLAGTGLVMLALLGTMRSAYLMLQGSELAAMPLLSCQSMKEGVCVDVATLQNPRLKRVALEVGDTRIVDRKHRLAGEVVDGVVKTDFPKMFPVLGLLPEMRQLPLTLEKRRQEVATRFPKTLKEWNGQDIEVSDFTDTFGASRLQGEARVKAIEALRVVHPDAQTTLDLALSEALASLLQEQSQTRGMPLLIATVVDTASGEVIAEAQSAALEASEFDPSMLAGTPFTQAYGEGRNLAERLLVPPASTFKAVLYLAAIEQGLGTKNRRCLSHPGEGQSGSVYVGRRYFHDYSHAYPHGNITLLDATVVSCNVYAIETALDLGRERVAQLLETLPLEQHTLGESDIDLALTAIGHGQLLTSARSLAEMFALFAREGQWQHCSTVFLKQPECEGKQVASAQAVTRLREVLRATVLRGTARAAKEPVDSPWHVLGKTGTATQVAFFEEEDSKLDHGLFAGLIEDAHHSYAVAILAPRAGKGAYAAALVPDVGALLVQHGYLVGGE